jgi:hypothetical protein
VPGHLAACARRADTLADFRSMSLPANIGDIQGHVFTTYKDLVAALGPPIGRPRLPSLVNPITCLFDLGDGIRIYHVRDLTERRTPRRLLKWRISGYDMGALEVVRDLLQNVDATIDMAPFFNTEAEYEKRVEYSKTGIKRKVAEMMSLVDDLSEDGSSLNDHAYLCIASKLKEVHDYVDTTST